MRDQHEPRDEFVERLQSTISHEVRRRNSLTESRGWTPRWQMKAAADMAALVIVSMAIGGAVVALAYQVQDNERRDSLSAVYLRQFQLAQQRLQLAQAEVQTAEQRRVTGLGTEEAILESRQKVAEAEVAVKVAQLQLEEVRLTAREPLNDVSSPLASGRDFVTERWRIERTVPLLALELERTRLRVAAQRFQLGTADSLEVAAVEVRVSDIEAGILAFSQKIDIRQRFLKGEFDAAMAGLRVQEVMAEQRRKALLPKVEFAQKGIQQAQAKFATGMATTIEVNEAKLRLLQLQTELAMTDLELALVRRKIDQLKGK